MPDPDEPPTDPHQVDPEQHRGHDTGILSRAFRLARRRRDDDHTAPRRIDPDRQGDRGRKR